MAKRPVAFISFRFEPVSEGYIFDDPSSLQQKGRLSLLIWRRKADGRSEVSEEHPLGEAHSIEEFERLVDEVKNDLARTQKAARDWFAPRRPFWR